MKPSESKYWEMVKKIRRFYADNGAELFQHPDDWGMFESDKTDGEIHIVFYWQTIDRVVTPDGAIIAVGGMGGGDWQKAKAEIEDYFGLELVKTRDGLTGERWYTYRATKNI